MRFNAISRRLIKRSDPAPKWCITIKNATTPDIKKLPARITLAVTKSAASCTNKYIAPTAPNLETVIQAAKAKLRSIAWK
ncbi:hypothetical protein D3C78_1472060 [compost metagenome]